MFNALELDSPDAGAELLPIDRESPPLHAPEYDPLSDHLDEPFPEEYR